MFRDDLSASFPSQSSECGCEGCAIPGVERQLRHVRSARCWVERFDVELSGPFSALERGLSSLLQMTYVN